MGEPSTKKRHVDAAGSGGEGPPVRTGGLGSFGAFGGGGGDGKVDMAVLEFQNKQLASRLDEKNRTLRDLTRKTETLSRRQVNYEATLSLVHRSWEQLNTDLQLILGRSGIRTTPENMSIHQGGSSTNATNQTSFLQRLLGTEPASLHEVKDGLEIRCSFTKSVLTALVEALDSARRGGGKVPDDELRQHNEALCKTNEDLQVMLRDCSAETALLRDRLLALQNRFDEVSQEYDNVKYDLDEVRRKMERLRRERTQPQETLQPPPPPVTVESPVVSRPSSPAGKSNKEFDLLDAELAKQRSLSESRHRELNKLRDERFEAIKQIQKLQTELAFSSAEKIIKSDVFLQMRNSFNNACQERDLSREEGERLREERDLWLENVKNEKTKIEAREVEHTAALSADLREAQVRLIQMKKERDLLTFQLENKAAHAENEVARMRELTLLVSSLQEQLKKQKSDARRCVTDVQRLRVERDKYKSDADKAQLDARHAVEDVRDSEKRYKEAMDELVPLKREKTQWKDEEARLRRKLENFNNLSREKRTLADLRLAEQQALEEKKSLQEELEADELHRKYQKIKEREVSLCDDLNRLMREKKEHARNREKADHAVRELSRQSEQLREERDTLMNEIEEIGKAFEDMQGQNERLLQQLSEQDNLHSQLISERIKATQVANLHREEQEVLERKLAAMEEMYSAQTMELQAKDARDKTMEEQVMRANDEIRALNLLLETYKRSSREIGHALQEHKPQMDALYKQATEIKERADRTELELQGEVYQRRRMEEELNAQQKKIERLSRDDYNSALEEEIQAYKKTLKCSVCTERAKDTVLTKCYHCFCRQCIRDRLDNRMRKCPRCGQPFGQEDVRQLFL